MRVIVVVALVIGSGSCFDTVVANDAQLACLGPTDCPDGFACDARGRCVAFGVVVPPAELSVEVGPALTAPGRPVSVVIAATNVVGDVQVVVEQGPAAPPLEVVAPVVDGEAAATVRFAANAASGARTVTARAANAAGVVTERTAVVTLDADAPTLVSTEVPATLGPTAPGAVTLTFSEDVTVQRVALEADTTINAVGAATGPRVWSGAFDVSGAADGAYDLIVDATDAAGNQLIATAVPVVVDALGPAIVDASALPAAALLDTGGVAVVRPGAPVIVDITASETVTGPPTVQLQRAGGEAFDVPQSGGGGRVFQVVMRVDDEGDHQGTVTLAPDPAGNPGASVAVGFTVDGTAPRVADIDLPRTAFIGSETITGSFTVSEPLARAPLVFLDDVLVPTQPAADAGPLAFTLALPLAGSGLDGVQQLTFSLEDFAGNASRARAGPVLSLDARAPRLLAAAFTPTVARADAFVLLTILADEALGEVPQLRFGADSADPVAVEVDGAGATFLFQSLPSGSYAVATVMLVDEAGNIAEVPVPEPAEATLLVDAEPPKAEVKAPRVVLTTADAVITAEIVPAEPLSLLPQVRLLGDPFTVVGPLPLGPFTATMPIPTNRQGDFTIEAELRDLAGNVAVALSEKVSIDTEPPSLVSLDIADRTVSAGQPIHIVIAMSEPGTATIEVDGPAPLLFPVPLVPTSAVRLQATPTVSGDYVVRRARLRDRHGQERVFDIDQREGRVVVDVVAPTPTVSVSATRFSREPGFNEVVAEITSNEPGTMGLFIDNAPIAGCESVTAGAPRTCRASVGAADNEGVHIVQVVAFDTAGNVGQAATTVVYDFTPPRPVRVEGGVERPPGCPVTPTALGAGGVATYVITTDEPVFLSSFVPRDGLAENVVRPDGPTVVVPLTILAVDGGDDGDAAIAAMLEDDVGNAGAALVDTVRLDRVSPAKPENLVFERRPFAVATQRPSFLVSAPPQTDSDVLIIYDDAQRGQEIGRLRSGESVTSVGTVDRARVFVNAWDAACNVDAATASAVGEVVLHVSSAGRVVGNPFSNPHRVLVREDGVAVDDRDAVEVEGALVADLDTLDIQLVGGLAARTISSLTRASGTAAYDPVRGRSVHVSVDPDQNVVVQEWTGGALETRTLVDPERDGNPRGTLSQATWDPFRRLVVVLESGGAAWGYNGTSWRRLTGQRAIGSFTSAGLGHVAGRLIASSRAGELQIIDQAGLRSVMQHPNLPVGLIATGREEAVIVSETASMIVRFNELQGLTLTPAPGAKARGVGTVRQSPAILADGRLAVLAESGAFKPLIDTDKQTSASGVIVADTDGAPLVIGDGEVWRHAAVQGLTIVASTAALLPNVNRDFAIADRNRVTVVRRDGTVSLLDNRQLSTNAPLGAPVLAADARDGFLVALIGSSEDAALLVRGTSTIVHALSDKVQAPVVLAIGDGIVDIYDAETHRTVGLVTGAEIAKEPSPFSPPPTELLSARTSSELVIHATTAGSWETFEGAVGGALVRVAANDIPAFEVPMPAGFDGQALVSAELGTLLIGGRFDDRPTSEVFLLERGTGQWRLLEQPLTGLSPRAGAAAVEVDGAVLVLGGAPVQNDVTELVRLTPAVQLDVDLRASGLPFANLRQVTVDAGGHDPVVFDGVGFTEPKGIAFLADQLDPVGAIMHVRVGPQLTPNERVNINVVTATLRYDGSE